ncbi:hypothetical protein HJG60_008994 [Phyllostomus discolor]|uniref:Uncharacterized protein n=1 Tax=Phyllostomus discolor TaxID=89673 RepID=A0A833YLQ8_9CHIR|nr:hypothetical protein HJG60_008994 [Phyllostomus discolor]
MIAISLPTPPPNPRNDGWSRPKSPGRGSLITLTQGWALSESLPPSENAGFGYCTPPLSQLSLDTKDPLAESKYIPEIKMQQYSSPINNGLLQKVGISKCPWNYLCVQHLSFRNFSTFTNQTGRFPYPTPNPLTTLPVGRCTCITHSALWSCSLWLSAPTPNL